MKTKNKITAPKLQVCAYMPAGEEHPALCIQILMPSGKFGSYLSPVVRRGDVAYDDLLEAASGSICWLYNTEPRPLV
jgi:hypothetical protein